MSLLMKPKIPQIDGLNECYLFFSCWFPSSLYILMLLRIYVRHKAFFTNINILTYGKVKMHCIPLVEKCDTLKPLYSSV